MSIYLFKDKPVCRWPEIKEFGRYKFVGIYVSRWNFFVKTGDKKVLLFSEIIVNRQDLVNAKFTKAVNTKFVVIRNISSIPFVKKTITEN